MHNQCNYTGSYRGAAHSICNLQDIRCQNKFQWFSIMVLIMTTTSLELVGEFEGQFECLRDNVEKYITFSVPIKKEIKWRQDNNIQNKLHR